MQDALRTLRKGPLHGASTLYSAEFIYKISQMSEDEFEKLCQKYGITLFESTGNLIEIPDADKSFYQKILEMSDQKFEECLSHYGETVFMHGAEVDYDGAANNIASTAVCAAVGMEPIVSIENLEGLLSLASCKEILDRYQPRVRQLWQEENPATFERFHNPALRFVDNRHAQISGTSCISWFSSLCCCFRRRDRVRPAMKKTVETPSP